nr:PREDICTED: cyclin-dependent kinase inhibitor 1B-like [Bemisia tabaci]
MRPRILSPLLMSEFNKMISLRNSSTSTASDRVEPRQLMRVKKNLFGPVNREDSRVFCENELRAVSQSSCEKWNFDFNAEKPLEVPNPRYLWVKVSPGDSIPESYGLKRLPYLSKNSMLLEQERISCNNNNNNFVLDDLKMSEKQTHITDYMKTRKRRISASAKIVEVVDQEDQSPRKRARSLTVGNSN